MKTNNNPSTSAVIVNQQYQPKKNYRINNESSDHPQFQAFNQMTSQNQQTFNNATSLIKSYATVLEQSLTTKDKHIIKELLANSDQEVIRNSVQGISRGKVGGLLEQVEILLLEDARNTKDTLSYIKWLKCIIKIHIGTIINNPQVQNIAARLSTIIKKRASFLPDLQQLDSKIAYQVRGTPEQIYVPKFHYIEEENDVIHRAEGEQQEEINGGQQDLGGMEDFEDDMDMDDYM